MDGYHFKQTRTESITRQQKKPENSKTIRTENERREDAAASAQEGDFSQKKKRDAERRHRQVTVS